MKFFQNLGKSIMLPVACMPLCGILMGIGYLMCPASMQGGAVTGLIPVIGMFLVKAGGALIDHIALLFAVGIGVGMSDDQHGTAGVTALVSWLIITSLLSAGFIQTIMPAIAELLWNRSCSEHQTSPVFTALKSASTLLVCSSSSLVSMPSTIVLW